MKLRIRPQWLFMLAFSGACHQPANSRERASSALRDSLGTDADPQVAFQRDSTHLLVQLATVAFPTMPEAALTGQAQSIAAFAVRHYENANQLDSVTVLYREAAPQPGVWYIRHERTFPIGELRNAR